MGGTWGTLRHGRREHNITCKYCGEDGLKWRPDDDGIFRLYEEERDERNRKILHQCDRGTRAEATDFDDLTKGDA